MFGRIGPAWGAASGNFALNVNPVEVVFISVNLNLPVISLMSLEIFPSSAGLAGVSGLTSSTGLADSTDLELDKALATF